MATSPNDLTRQQLDELDALLQKMLAVPIAAADSTPVPSVEVPELPEPVGSWRMDAPTPAVTRAPHMTPTAVPAMAEAIPVAATPQKYAAEPVFLETRIDPRSFTRPDASANVPMPRLFGPSEPQMAPPEMTFVPPPIQNRSTFVPPMQIEPVEMTPMQAMPDYESPMMREDVREDVMAVPLSMAEPTTVSGGVPIAMWPVYGVNKVIEGVLGLFGPPGELFRMTGMKWLLGLAGIAMLLAAAAWSARGMGWMTF